MQRTPASPEIIAEIDWTAPTAVVDGCPRWTVRCRVPFTFECSDSLALVTPPRIRAEGDEEEMAAPDPLEPDADGNYTIKGISSSTSVDWYGTEMTRNALASMAAQMMAEGGVPVVPTHWNSEWDDVMGKTLNAVVREGSVENPADMTETAYVLEVESLLYGSAEKTPSLVKALVRGQKIGRSIGGWFTEMTFISNEDGDVERILIEDVSLDHDAFTRSPANPDSWIQALRSVMDKRPAEQRSIASIEETDGVSHITYRAVGASQVEAAEVRAEDEGDLPPDVGIGDGEVEDPIVEDPPQNEADVVELEADAAEGADDAEDDSEDEPPAGELSAEVPPEERAGAAADPPTVSEASADDASTLAEDPAEERTMDNDQVLALLQEIRSGQQSTDDRLAALEARTTQATKTDEPTVEERLAAYKAQLAERDRAIAKLATQPVSRGRGGPSVLASTPKDKRVERSVQAAENMGLRNVASLIKGDESFAKRFVDEGPNPYAYRSRGLSEPGLFERQAAEADEDLYAFFRMAEADCLIGQGSNTIFSN